MTDGDCLGGFGGEGGGSTRPVEDYGPAHHERLGGLELVVARGTPHRLRAKTPEPRIGSGASSASPLGEGKNWATLGGYQGLVASIWYLVRLVTWMGWLWVKSLNWVLSGRVG